MSYLEELRSHYKQVKSRLEAPPMVPFKKAKPDVRVIRIVNGRQVRNIEIKAPPKVEALPPPPPPPPPAITLAPAARGMISFEAILFVVAKHYGLRRGDLLGPDRSVRLVRARHTAMYLARQFGRSYPSIGRRMFRDHSSIVHACGKMERRLAVEPELAETMAFLHQQLEQMVAAEQAMPAEIEVVI